MQKMLIADGSEFNRSVLYEVFASKYEILRTDNSGEALKLLAENRDQLAAAFINESLATHFNDEGLRMLASLKIAERFPVVLIAEEEITGFPHHKLRLEYSDVLASPVNPAIARRRVANLMEMFHTRRKLEQLVDEQTKTILEQNNELRQQQKKINSIQNEMLDTLSTVIEYRDLESGRHIHRIRRFTEVLLRILAEKYPRYQLTEEKIELISAASSLHDIGKIAIPDSVLLSPGRLTYEEFRIMKQHTIKGCEILDQLESVEKNEYFRYCYDICRYHHEKWDGMGYPDGLVGDQIPIWAQVVSLADSYDALTSERPYKTAYSHEQAVEMIRGGACGAFSDEMMDCFSQALPQLKELAAQYADISHADRSMADARLLSPDDEKHEDSLYQRMDRSDLIDLIEHQKTVLADMQQQDRSVLHCLADFVFLFDLKNNMLCEEKGSMKDICGYIPKNYEEAVSVLADCWAEENRSAFTRRLRLPAIMEALENGADKLTLEGRMEIGSGDPSDIVCIVVPLTEEEKVTKIYLLLSVRRPGSDDQYGGDDRDTVTGLWNYVGAKREIDEYLSHEGKNGCHALVMIDIDNFHQINRQAGYRFGNDILREVTGLLKYQVSGSSVLARIEDDNFVVMLKDCPDKEERDLVIGDIFKSVCRSYLFEEERSPDISASVGVALYPVDGSSFEELFDNASRAVELCKLNGRNMVLYYNSSMQENWELKKYASTLRVQEKAELDAGSFEEYFIPVVDSASGYIMAYDMIGVGGDYLSRLTTLEGLFEAFDDNHRLTAFSLNTVNRLLASLSALEQENLALPELAIPTMFNGKDADTVPVALEEILRRHPVNCENVCLLLAHEMIDDMTVADLTAFVSRLRGLGFRVGVYNVGIRNINVNCFVENLFDRVVFAKSFIQAISDAVYDIELLSNLVRYFDKLGARCILPGGIGEETAYELRRRTDYAFGVHKEELISLAEFKNQMAASSVIREVPLLSHEHNSLVLNEKLYDEILEQTRSFILEWTPRFDRAKLSGSFEHMYGFAPETEDFVRRLNERTLIHSDDCKKLIEKLHAARSEQPGPETFIRVYSRREDDYIWNRVSFAAIRNTSDIPARIMAVFTALSESRDQTMDAARSDRTDFITSLYNKHATENKIKNYLYDEGAAQGHAFIMAEIVGFEALEKNLGSVFANAVLKGAAQNIRELFRDSDIIGRSSGSRFTVLIKGMNAREKVQEKAEQIVKMLSSRYQSDSGELAVSGKVGVSLFPRDGSTYDELYSAALRALYFAKHNPHVDVCFADGNVPALPEKNQE